MSSSTTMWRRCSHCGNNGHNSRTCLDNKGGFKLFGVRLSADCCASPAAPAESSSSSSTAMRKSVSMGNLCNYGATEGGASPLSPSHYEHHDQGDPVEGYASDDLVHTSSTSRERKKGIPWTEEEHRMFLLGLQKLGKGDWRGISRNFVKTRTPTQVASHAQKYFLRRNNLNKRRRRSSLFDITPDTVSSLVEEPVLEEAGCDDPDVCPELTLGQSIPYRRIREVEFPGNAYSLGVFPVQVQSFPLAYGPMGVSNVVCEAPNMKGMQANDGGEIAEKGNVQLPLDMDVMEVVPEVNDDVEGGSNLLAFRCPPIPPLWQGQGFYGTLKHDMWTESKIVRPIPVVPNPPQKAEDNSKSLTSDSNVGQRVMEPSPLSYKLLEEGSRHSAFHATSSPPGNGEVKGQGSLSSAISVP